MQCTALTILVGRLLKLLLAFGSIVIPGFSVLEIHDQDFYSLLRYVRVLKWGLPFNKEGVGLSV
jgi:hypothetical protein